jgi:hypothetical protein
MMRDHVAHREARQAAFRVQRAALERVDGLGHRRHRVGQPERHRAADRRVAHRDHELLDEVEEGHRLAVGDEVGLSAHARARLEPRLGRDHRVHEVVDVGEVRKLVAPADGAGQLPFPRLADDARDEAVVLGAEHHVRADGAGARAALPVRREHELLGPDLAVGIRRLRDARVRQALVAVLDVAALVYGAGRADVHQPRDRVGAACGQDVLGTAEVHRPHVLDPVVLGVHQRGVVDHRVHAGAGGGHGLAPADVERHEAHARVEGRVAQVGAGDLVAQVGESPHQRAADEALPARDQDPAPAHRSPRSAVPKAWSQNGKIEA